MQQQPGTPWQYLQDLQNRRHKSRVLLSVLLGILGILLADLYFVGQTHDSMFGSNVVSLLALLTVSVTVYVVYKSIQDDLELKLLSRDDLVNDFKRKNLENSKELLRKAGLESIKRRLVSVPHSLPEQFSPAVQERFYASPSYSSYSPYPIYSQPSPVIQPQLQLNLKSFDYSDELAENFLRSKGLDTRIRNWMENVRKWFAKELIPMVLTSHIENLMILNKLLREFSATKERFWIFEGSFDETKLIDLTYEERTHYKRVNIKEIQDLAVEIGCVYARDIEACRNYSIQGQQQPQQELAQKRVTFVDAIRQRIILEKYFDIPGYNARAYTISRLHNLSRTSCLSGYSSSSGGAFLSDAWTPKKPTDAHIIANLFFRMLNNANNTTQDPTFDMIQDFLISFPNVISQNEKPNKVYFYQKNPDSCVEPHYDVISGGETWNCYKGNNNLFCAVSLFLLHVKIKNDGYFYSMDCHELYHLIS